MKKNNLTILGLVGAITFSVVTAALMSERSFSFYRTSADIYTLTVDSNNISESDFVDENAVFTARNGKAHFEIENGSYLENGIVTLHNGGTIKKYFNNAFEGAYGLSSINVNYYSNGGYVEVITCYSDDFVLTTTTGLGASSTTDIGGNYYYIKAVGGDININSFTITYGCSNLVTPSNEPDPSDDKNTYHYDSDDLAGFAEIGDSTYYYVRGKFDGMNPVADNFELRSDATLTLQPAFLENYSGYFQIYFELDSFINSNEASINPHLYYKNKPFIAFNNSGDVRLEEGSAEASDDGSHAKIGSQYLKISYWWGMATIRKTDSISVSEDASKRYLKITTINGEPYLQFTGTIKTSSVAVAKEFAMPTQYEKFDTQKYGVWESSKADMNPDDYIFEKSSKYTVKYYVNVQIKISSNGYDASGAINQYIIHMNGSDLTWSFMGGFDHVEKDNLVTIKNRKYKLYQTGSGWEETEIWLGVQQVVTSYNITDVDVIEVDNKPLLVISGVYGEGTSKDDIYVIDWELSGQSNGNITNISGDKNWAWSIRNATPYEVEVTNESSREFNVKFDISSLFSLQEQSLSGKYGFSPTFAIGNPPDGNVINISGINKEKTLSTKKCTIIQNDQFWWHVGLIIENK